MWSRSKYRVRGADKVFARVCTWKTPRWVGKYNVGSTHMHPRHDEGIWAAGVLRQVVVTVQLVPSELSPKKERGKKKAVRNVIHD